MILSLLKYSASYFTGTIKSLSGNSGNIANPSKNNYNVHMHWKISVPSTKKIKLFFNLHRFEFQEDCPYDYIEVRDGGNGQSPLIGKYCRNPRRLLIESTSNELFITYHADNSYKSLFKLFYVAVTPNQGKPILNT